jgi:hypothetical protein
MPFRHVVMFQFADHVTDDDVEQIRDGLSSLPGQIEQIRSYVHGRDVEISEGNFDYAVVADFDNVRDFVEYRDHPAHQLVIAERITPNITSRAAVQYQYGAH